MKSYKYSTKERAERVSKTLGCTGYHYHNENGERKYMPCKDMKTFKEKTQKKSKGKEEEVTELVSDDGTWLTSDIRIMDPASTGIGTKTTDQIVAQTKTPRDVFMRGGVSLEKVLWLKRTWNTHLVLKIPCLWIMKILLNIIKKNLS